MPPADGAVDGGRWAVDGAWAVGGGRRGRRRAVGGGRCMGCRRRTAGGRRWAVPSPARAAHQPGVNITGPSISGELAGELDGACPTSTNRAEIERRYHSHREVADDETTETSWNTIQTLQMIVGKIETQVSHCRITVRLQVALKLLTQLYNSALYS